MDKMWVYQQKISKKIFHLKYTIRRISKFSPLVLFFSVHKEIGSVHLRIGYSKLIRGMFIQWACYMHEVMPQHATRQLISPAHTDNSNDNWERKTDATPTPPPHAFTLNKILNYLLNLTPAGVVRKLKKKKLDVVTTKSVFFWVIPRCQNFVCRRFGTFCSIFIG